MKVLKLKHHDRERVFITSDLHFCHPNILKFARFEFENIQDMEREMIRRWNEVVTFNDVVFVLGDIFWKKPECETHKLIQKLHARRIYIVPGNHDFVYPPKREDLLKDPRVIILDDVVALHLYRADGEIFEIYLSHFPLGTWPHRPQGAYNLHGHLHSDPTGHNNEYYSELPKQKDIGMDSNNLYPYDIWEALSQAD